MNNLRRINSVEDLDLSKINEFGAYPVILVDSSRLATEGLGAILMSKYTNPEAIEMTLDKSVAMLWSTTRQCLWTPGAVSGSLLRATDIYTDMQRESLMYDVRGDFPAQHTGLLLPCFLSEYIGE